MCLTTNDDVYRLLSARKRDSFRYEGTGVDGKNILDGRVDRVDGLEMRLVFRKLIKVDAPKIRQHNPLTFGSVSPPFEARLLKILNNQIILELEWGNGASKLCRAAIGLVKIKKCKAHPKAALKQ